MEILPYLPVPDTRPKPVRQRSVPVSLAVVLALLGPPTWGVTWLVWAIVYPIKRHQQTLNLRAATNEWQVNEDWRFSIIERNARIDAMNMQVAIMSTPQS